MSNLPPGLTWERLDSDLETEEERLKKIMDKQEAEERWIDCEPDDSYWVDFFKECDR